MSSHFHVTRQLAARGWLASTSLRLYLTLKATWIPLTNWHNTALGRTHGRNSETCTCLKVEPASEPKVSPDSVQTVWIRHNQGSENNPLVRVCVCVFEHAGHITAVTNDYCITKWAFRFKRQVLVPLSRCVRLLWATSTGLLIETKNKLEICCQREKFRR